MVPRADEEGGTYVIPGHGRLCDRNVVANYRDMVTIVRDRIEDLVKKGKTLDQVKAARANPGLRRHLRRGLGILDHGHVHRGHLSRSECRSKSAGAKSREAR